MSWPRPDDPDYAHPMPDDDVETKLDERPVGERGQLPSSGGHGPALDRAFAALIQEKTESLDGRVERIEGFGKELVEVAQGALLWLRIFVCGMLLLGVGFLGTAVLGVALAAIR